ncbi:hypothetical protein HDU93_004898 [Gonapodya sp. JEL0774]|nr:hypothetical protein HDU93_004898 [Gonapodya sp. JEL0774]
MSNQDIILISAVESGDLARVRGALKAGASPNARKVAKFKWRVFSKKEDQGGVVSGVGNPDVKEETHAVESAVALSIIAGRADIVSLLVLAGADIHQPVEWKISSSSDEIWVADSWTDYHCLTFSYPNALTLAIGRGGRVKWDCKANRTDWQHAMDKGEVRINKKGGMVLVEDAKVDADACEVRMLIPALDVVSLLLCHGASVSDTVLRSAEKLEDARFSRLIAHHQELLVKETLAQHEAALAGRPRTPVISAPQLSISPNVSPSQPESAMSRPSSNPELESWITTLESRIMTLESTNTALRLELSTTQADLLTLRNHESALEAQGAATKFEVLALKALVADLSREVTSLRHDLNPSGAGTREAGSVSVVVEKVMVVTAPYVPKAADEIALGSGKKVFVKKTYKDGWGEGFDLSSSTAGFFPLNHLSEPTVGTTGTSVVSTPVAPRRGVSSAPRNDGTGPVPPSETATV